MSEHLHDDLPPIGARVRLSTGDEGYVLGYKHLTSIPTVRIAWDDGMRATAWPRDLTVLDPAPWEEA